MYFLNKKWKYHSYKRYGHSASKFRDKIYIFGGNYKDSLDSMTNTFYKFDVKTFQMIKIEFPNFGV